MGAVSETRYVVQAGWDHAPHLDEETKRRLLASIEPHLRDARTKGEPSMGSGTIYPIAWEEVSVPPMAIPPFWPRAYGMDVGWNRTAALWGALDRSTGTIYCPSEYYGAKQPPEVHAAGIRARGDWIPGVIDPASRGRSQADGTQLLATYTSKGLGLKLTPAKNAVEAGIQEVWSLLVTGRLKFFSSLKNLEKEFHYYRRDENGKIVKQNDHLMDALRYMIVSGVPLMKTQEMRRTVASPGAADLVAGY